MWIQGVSFNIYIYMETSVRNENLSSVKKAQDKW